MGKCQNRMAEKAASRQIVKWACPGLVVLIK